MRNGFFKLVQMADGFGLKIYSAKDGGKPNKVLDVLNYLENVGNLEFNPSEVKLAVESNNDVIIKLGDGTCPKVRENCILRIADDKLSATAIFYPASDGAERMSKAELINDLKMRGVIFGIAENILESHFSSAGLYNTEFIVAKGKAPRQGYDAKIVYHFNTELKIAPTLREDGTADYFNLNMINQVHQGDLIAEIIPEDPGEAGMDILGNKINPRDVKREKLNFGNNLSLSEDRLKLTAMCDGHVALFDSKIILSNVYEVNDVNTATGNIIFDGSVLVNGSVATNFTVKATGNVVVKGVVEGAYVEAGKDIVISRGMNGMGKGVLKAGGNVICKFIENSTVTAKGNVNTDAILHSQVISGAEINVTGRKGFITGGKVQAIERIAAKNIGSDMGARTIVEVGQDPILKNEYMILQKNIEKLVADIKQAQPTITAFMEKKLAGARISTDQLLAIKKISQKMEMDKKDLEEKNAKLKVLEQQFNPDINAQILVSGAVYPGTTIIINDDSLDIKSSLKYCRFERKQGEIKMSPL